MGGGASRDKKSEKLSCTKFLATLEKVGGRKEGGGGGERGGGRGGGG